jgi:hypothetical protein
MINTTATDTNTIDKKNKVKSKTITTDNVVSIYSNYIATVLMIIVIIFVYFGTSGLVLYLCKLSQANIVPTCMPGDTEVFNEEPTKTGGGGEAAAAPVAPVAAEQGSATAGGGDAKKTPQIPVTTTHLFIEKPDENSKKMVSMKFEFPHKSFVSKDPTWEQLSNVNLDIKNFKEPVKPIPIVENKNSNNKNKEAKTKFDEDTKLYEKEKKIYDDTLKTITKIYHDWKIPDSGEGDDYKHPNINELLTKINEDLDKIPTDTNKQIEKLTNIGDNPSNIVLRHFVLVLKNIDVFKEWQTNNQNLKESNSLNIIWNFINKKKIDNDNFIFNYFLLIFQWLLWLPNVTITTVMNYMNENFKEWIIILIGPLILYAVLFLLVGVIPFFYVGVCVFNFGLIAKEKQGDSPYSQDNWDYMELSWWMFIRLFTWWILLPLAMSGFMLLPIICLLMSIWCIFAYNGELNIVKSGVFTLSANVLKEYKTWIVSIIGLYIVFTAFTDLGLFEGALALAIIFSIYTKVIDIDLFEPIKQIKTQILAKELTNAFTQSNAKKCIPKDVSSGKGGFFSQLWKIFTSKFTAKNMAKNLHNPTPATTQQKTQQQQQPTNNNQPTTTTQLNNSTNNNQPTTTTQLNNSTKNTATTTQLNNSTKNTATTTTQLNNSTKNTATTTQPK